jgi:hypothetical protein
MLPSIESGPFTLYIESGSFMIIRGLGVRRSSIATLIDVSVNGLPKNKPFGLPNPFVSFLLDGEQEQKMPTLQRTRNPKWEHCDVKLYVGNKSCGKRHL